MIFWMDGYLFRLKKNSKSTIYERKFNKCGTGPQKHI